MANIIDQLEISGIVYDIQDASAQAALPGKQDTLVSGVNIKTINNESLLGSGNIEIQGGTGDAYTKAETDALLATKADTSAMTEDIEAAVSGKADTSAVTAAIDAAVSGKANSSDVYLKSETSSSTEINNALETKADASTTYSKTEVDTAINAATSGKADTSAVTAAINAATSGKADADDVYTKTETDTLLNNKADTSAMTADIEAAVSGKADTSAVTAAIDAATSGKQDTLVSGTNIKTINNESLLGSGNITIQGGGNVVELTQAEYDALVVKDPDTFYVITDAVEIDANNFYLKTQTSSSTQIAAALQTKADAATTSSSTQISDALAGKQNTLTAGTGIDITNDVISVTGGGGGGSYTAGRGISISNDQISLDVPVYKTDWIGSSVVIGLDNVASVQGATDCLVGGFYCGIENADSSAGHGCVAMGFQVNTKNGAEAAVGKHNATTSASTTFGDSGNTLFTVGNGNAFNVRHNAFEVRANGDIYFPDTNNTTYQNYYEKPMLKLQDVLAGKQPMLTAGTGIDITNNVISVTGGGGGGGKAVSAGTNISITTGETADTINCTLPISAIGSQGTIRQSIKIGTGNANAYGDRVLVMGNSINADFADTVGFGTSISLGAKTSYAMGINLNTSNEGQFTCGYYNTSAKESNTKGSSGNTLFCVGNGYYHYPTEGYHNALEIRQNGDIYYADTNNTTYQNYYEKPMIKLQDKFDEIDTIIGDINTILSSL